MNERAKEIRKKPQNNPGDSRNNIGWKRKRKEGSGSLSLSHWNGIQANPIELSKGLE